MTAPVANPISLGLDAVADELGISQVEVARLIAKRQLPATKVGNRWLVLPESVAAYLKRGAPNAKLPGFQHGAGWFTEDNLSQLAESLSDAVAEAGADQWIAEAQVRAYFAANRLMTSLDRDLEARGAVADVLKRSVPVSPFAPKLENKESRFRNWSEVCAVYEIRRTARDEIIGAKNLTASPITALYDSPEEFAKISDAAYAAAAKRRIAARSKFYKFSDGVFGPISVDRRVSMSLPMREILTPAARERLLALAF